MRQAFTARLRVFITAAQHHLAVLSLVLLLQAGEGAADGAEEGGEVEEEAAVAEGEEGSDSIHGGVLKVRLRASRSCLTLVLMLLLTLQHMFPETRCHT